MLVHCSNPGWHESGEFGGISNTRPPTEDPTRNLQGRKRAALGFCTSPRFNGLLSDRHQKRRKKNNELTGCSTDGLGWLEGCGRWEKGSAGKVASDNIGWTFRSVRGSMFHVQFFPILNECFDPLHGFPLCTHPRNSVFRRCSNSATGCEGFYQC